MSKRNQETKPQDTVLAVGNLIATAFDVAEGVNKGKGVLPALSEAFSRHGQRAKALSKKSAYAQATESFENENESTTAPQRVQTDIRPQLFCDCCKLPPLQCHQRDAQH